jgi:uncharacterized metal-binding protein
MQNQKTKPFELPSDWERFSSRSLTLKQRILGQILPSRYLKLTLILLFFSFSSPLTLLYVLPLEDIAAYPIAITTFSLLFLLFAGLVLVLLIQLRNPYLQELKEKLGYME